MSQRQESNILRQRQLRERINSLTPEQQILYAQLMRQRENARAPKYANGTREQQVLNNHKAVAPQRIALYKNMDAKYQKKAWWRKLLAVAGGMGSSLRDVLVTVLNLYHLTKYSIQAVLNFLKYNNNLITFLGILVFLGCYRSEYLYQFVTGGGIPENLLHFLPGWVLTLAKNYTAETRGQVVAQVQPTREELDRAYQLAARFFSGLSLLPTCPLQSNPLPQPTQKFPIPYAQPWFRPVMRSVGVAALAGTALGAAASYRKRKRNEGITNEHDPNATQTPSWKQRALRSPVAAAVLSPGKRTKLIHALRQREKNKRERKLHTELHPSGWVWAGVEGGQNRVNHPTKPYPNTSTTSIPFIHRRTIQYNRR